MLDDGFLIKTEHTDKGPLKQHEQKQKRRHGIVLSDDDDCGGDAEKSTASQGHKHRRRRLSPHEGLNSSNMYDDSCLPDI